MDKIEIGEFVRTTDGVIGKVEKYSNYEYWINCSENNDIWKCGIDYIVKHSKDIIDLLEVGDFVNERLVLQVDYKNKNICLLIPFTDTKANTSIMWYGHEDIKTILTKEMYEQNCYRLEVKDE